MATAREERLTYLFENHYDEVLAYCTRRVGSSDADDVAAAVFSTAWRRYDDIRWETVRPWLYGIARGVIANRWRSSKRTDRLVKKISGLAPSHVESPDVFVVRREQDLAVTTALKRLKPADQEILMLAAWEQLSAPEMATTLGISTSAAEQRLHRAKKRLEKSLKTPEVPVVEGEMS